MVVVMKPLDEQGYVGYGVDVNGTIWSRWNTRGKLTVEWRERTPQPKRTRHRERERHNDESGENGSLYVKLKKGKRQVDVLVAKLLLVAAFGPLPAWKGFKIRYENGRRDDCRLVNLSYAPHPNNPHFASKFGSRFANENPPGFTAVNIP